MDSNFQVKITADLGDLTAKIKNIEATLAKLDSSFKKAGAVASTSFKDASKTIANVGMDMNRARLATFAFGQVIRDAGFFSQSFGLGLLAISNNIPILIDQLVMLSGISAGVGAAISLLGSFLTAGLTIFAYWAQSVQSDGKSVGGAIQKMALDSENIIGKLVNFLSRPPASEILNGVISGIITGFNAIKGYFDAYVDLIMAIWDKFGDDITSGTSRTFTFIKDILTNALSIFVNLVKLATGLISGDFNLMGKSILNIFKAVFNQVINLFGNFIKNITSGIGGFVSFTNPALGAAISQSGKNFQDFANKNKFATDKLIDFNFNLKQSVSELEFADTKTKKTTDSVDKLAKAYEDLKGKLRGIIGDPSISFFEGAKQKADAVADTIRKLLELGEDPRSKKLEELYKDFKGLQLGAIKPVAAKMTTETQQNTFNASQELGNEEFLTRTKNKVIEIGDAVKRVKESYKGLDELSKSAIRLVGGDLTNAFLTMLNTGELSFKSLAKAIGDMIKKLIAAALAALILVALLSAIGLADFKNFGKNFVQGFQTLGGVKFADGGIVSGPTNALIGEYAGAKNNPEVVAPLDKLKSLISDTGGNGNMVGQLETRVSGNDLVILMNRASKNRNGYY
jgi:hypothetical protein